MQIDQNGITTENKELFFKNIEEFLQNEYTKDFEILPDSIIENIANLVWLNNLDLTSIIEFISTQYNPESASGDWQDSLYERIGIHRYPPQKTVFSACVSGSKNFYCDAESITIRSKTDNNEFVNTTAFTTNSQGDATIDFQCITDGIITVSPNDEFDIVIAPEGINTIVLADDFQLVTGCKKESDDDYRERFRISKSLNSCASRFSSISGMSQYVESQEFLEINDKKDENGMESGKIEIIAHHNTTDEIFAKAIYDMTAEGTELIGNTSVTIKDERGEDIEIRFEKAEPLEVSILATIKIDAGYNNDTVISIAKSKVVEYVKTRRFGLGSTIYATEFIIPLLNTPGIEAVTEVKIKSNGEPTDCLLINKKQIPIITEDTTLLCPYQKSI